MKKSILILLCCAMLISTVSCDTNNENNNSDINTTNLQTTSSATTAPNTTASSTTDTDNANNIDYNSKQDTINDFSKLNFYDMNSSYDSFYINRNPVAKYAVTDDLKLCVYIQEWDEYRAFPFNYEKTQDLINCISIYENNGVLINEAYGKTTGLTALLFSKKNNKIVECNINLDRTIFLSGLFCDFLDKNNGYIFVFEETTNDFSPKGCDRLAFLFKTHDGGETWTKTKGKDVPMVASNERPIIAEFIDDNIGIISCRYSGSEDMCQRTFFTSDGGKTWETMSALPYDFKGKNGYDATEIEDFSYANGEYLLNVTVRTGGGNGLYHLAFKSYDLNSWILIK